mmetsp:Transcript_141812/g.453078  ORF Transcript_141812/g.453078 Transcript_141812/m.453078 type:complete len:261 (-) Transcript_141812:588-1370(-)
MASLPERAGLALRQELAPLFFAVFIFLFLQDAVYNRLGSSNGKFISLVDTCRSVAQYRSGLPDTIGVPISCQTCELRCTADVAHHVRVGFGEIRLQLFGVRFVGQGANRLQRPSSHLFFLSGLCVDVVLPWRHSLQNDAKFQSGKVTCRHGRGLVQDAEGHLRRGGCDGGPWPLRLRIARGSARSGRYDAKSKGLPLGRGPPSRAGAAECSTKGRCERRQGLEEDALRFVPRRGAGREEDLVDDGFATHSGHGLGLGRSE